MYLCRDFRGNISMTVHSASDLPYLKIFFIFEAIEKRKKASRSTQKDKFSDRADFSNSGNSTSGFKVAICSNGSFNPVQMFQGS